MAPVTPLIEGGYEGERKGKRWQFRARPGEGARRVDSAGRLAAQPRQPGSGERMWCGSTRGRRRPDRWGPRVSEGGRKEAGWAGLGWAGSTGRLGFLFYPYFPKNINKYIFEYL
jgi:hypothetical protein